MDGGSAGFGEHVRDHGVYIDEVECQCQEQGMDHERSEIPFLYRCFFHALVCTPTVQHNPGTGDRQAT